jgi:hypothetical protein
MSALRDVWFHVQRQLLPALQEEIGQLTALDREFCEVISLINLEPFLERYRWIGNGCPPRTRAWLIHAFIAKSVYQFPTTGALIQALKSQPALRQLCGWDALNQVPSEATFSRAFAAFAKDELPQKIHEQMILSHCKEKLAGHVSRDATAIRAEERPGPKPPKPMPPPPRKRGRPVKGAVREPVPLKPLDLQMIRPLEENIASLPKVCAIGCKRNSQGHQETWVGYKLHTDTIDGDIPVSLLLTSASTHDSQAAIPLAQMTVKRVTSLYDLMDTAYDAPQIWAFSKQLGHVPIIDRNPRSKGIKIQMEPAHQQRFAERSSAERVNSRLKQRYGGRWVKVRGAAKVMAHLTFGVIALTANALLGRLY